MAWLGELAGAQSQLEAANTRVIAISADSPTDLIAKVKAQVPWITTLTDPDLIVTKAWGLHEASAQVPPKATFVVGRDGVIKFRHVGTEEQASWPKLDAVLAAVK